MGNTKLPLTVWLLAIYRISKAETGVSLLALMRHRGVSYPTELLPHQTINRAMSVQDEPHQLEGTVQIDNADLSVELAGDKAGRGRGKRCRSTPPSRSAATGSLPYMALVLASSRTLGVIGKWAEASLSPEACLMSDGLGCFAAVTRAGCLHMSAMVGACKPRHLLQFKWINTVLGNLMTTLARTFHALKLSEYAVEYLSAFAYRFERPSDLRALVAHSIADVTRCSPVTRETVKNRTPATRF